jgi:dUTPase
MPLDLIVELPRKERPDLPGQVRELLDRYKKVYAYVRAKGDAVIKRNAQLYTGKETTYQPGALLWYLSPKRIPGKSWKLTNRWVGPVEVVEQKSEVLVSIRSPRSPQKVVVVHVGRLRPYYYGSTQGHVREGELDGADEDDLDAEEVANSGGEPVSINIPVNVPLHVPEMVDKGKGSALPREPDPVEETQAKADKKKVLKEVQDEIEPERRGVVRGRSTSPESRAPRLRRKHEPRRGTVRARSTDSSESEHQSTRARIERRGIVRPREDDSSDENRPIRPKVEHSEGDGPRGTDVPLSKLIYTDASSDGSSGGGVAGVGEVKVQLGSGSGVPRRQGGVGAGYDVKAAETRTLLGGQTQAVSLDLVCQVPPSHCLQLSSRKSLASQGILVVSETVYPVIGDKLSVLIFNSSKKPYTVRKGTRIAQVTFRPQHEATFVDGGFGAADPCQ